MSVNLDLLCRIASTTAEIAALNQISAQHVGTAEIVSGGMARHLTPDQATGRALDLIEEREELIAAFLDQHATGRSRIDRRAADRLLRGVIPLSRPSRPPRSP